MNYEEFDDWNVSEDNLQDEQDLEEIVLKKKVTPQKKTEYISLSDMPDDFNGFESTEKPKQKKHGRSLSMFKPFDDDETASEGNQRGRLPDYNKLPKISYDDRDISEDDDDEDCYEDKGFLDRLLAFMKDNSPKAIAKKTFIIFSVLFWILAYLFQALSISTFTENIDGESGGMSFNPIRMFINDGPTLIVFAVVIAGITAGVYWYRFGFKQAPKKEVYALSENGTYGTAKLANVDDLSDVTIRGEWNRPAGLPLCLARDNYGAMFSLCLQTGPMDNKNMAIFGASGSGKSYAFVKPAVLSCIDHRYSYFVTDPSGEIYRDTAMAAKEAGHIVKVLNLKKLAMSNGLNPLARFATMEKTEIQTQINILVSSILDNTKKEGERRDPFFDPAEENLLKALILYVAVTPRPLFRGEEYERHLGTVYDLITKLNAQGGELEELDNLPDTDLAKAPWKIFCGAGRLKSNVMLGLGVKLQLFQNEMLAEVFSHDEIDLDMPGQKPCAYYIISSVNNNAFRFILSLFFSCAFESLITQAEESPRGYLDVPTYFLFDEFKAIGTINGFSDKLANVRKYNIGVAIIFQDPSQVEANYPRQSGSILANCDTWIVVGVNDQMTAKMVSDRTGEATIVNISVSEQKAGGGWLGSSGMQNVSTSDGKRMVYTPNEIIKMARKDVLVVCRGKDVFKGEAYGWVNHYFADFVRHNQTHYNQHHPDWQDHEKTMDKKRSFQALGETVSVPNAPVSATPEEKFEIAKDNMNQNIKKHYPKVELNEESRNLVTLFSDDVPDKEEPKKDSSDDYKVVDDDLFGNFDESDIII